MTATLGHKEWPITGYAGYGSCTVCRTQWSGVCTSHCSGCHRTFSSLSAFDKHRSHYRCLDPAVVGLVPTVRKHWSGWALPGDRGEVFDAR